MKEETTLQTQSRASMSIFSSSDESVYELAKKKATALSSSTMVPKEYQGNVANCLVAIEVANRVGIGPFEVMQNMNVIQGRPAWSSAYIIASLNTCGRFEPINFEFEDLGEQTIEYTVTSWSNKTRTRKKEKITVNNIRCRVVTTGLRNGKEYTGTWVSIEMAVQEGWYQKDGSKWQTMPEQMLQYRAASFFSRVYAPDVILGMQSTEELVDIGSVNATRSAPSVSDNEVVADDVDFEEASDPIAAINKKVEKTSKKEVAEKVEQVVEEVEQTDEEYDTEMDAQAEEEVEESDDFDDDFLE